MFKIENFIYGDIENFYDWVQKNNRQEDIIVDKDFQHFIEPNANLIGVESNDNKIYVIHENNEMLSNDYKSFDTQIEEFINKAKKYAQKNNKPVYIQRDTVIIPSYYGIQLSDKNLQFQNDYLDVKEGRIVPIERYHYNCSFSEFYPTCSFLNEYRAEPWTIIETRYCINCYVPTHIYDQYYKRHSSKKTVKIVKAEDVSVNDMKSTLSKDNMYYYYPLIDKWTKIINNDISYMGKKNRL